mmetsp:Transcript_24981/g.28546  ORF Transcript_24981/g.28546 Transcript_24981/m.28546 type:complete len:81 (+) Transcript_24981:285-527(+)
MNPNCKFRDDYYKNEDLVERSAGSPHRVITYPFVSFNQLHKAFDNKNETKGPNLDRSNAIVPDALILVHFNSPKKRKTIF